MSILLLSSPDSVTLTILSFVLKAGSVPMSVSPKTPVGYIVVLDGGL